MLRKLFGRSKKEEISQPVTLSTAVESAIFGVVGARAIPLMPSAAQKAFQLATDPNAEARDFIEVIESDEALSARVIKIANSVYFDRGKKSNTIEESVLVIGINELRCLLNATTLADIFPSAHPGRAQFWSNDIATALISRSLAQRFMPGKEDAAFLGGLMHDLGKLLLIQRAADLYQRVVALVQEHGRSFCEAETTVFPFDHTEVGLLIGRQWSFSEELCAVLRHHHDPWPSPPSALSLPVLVHAADTISHALGCGHPKGFVRFQRRSEEELPKVWEVLGLPESEQREFLNQLRKTMEMEFDLYAGAKVGA